jgi:hypothetical protein
MAPVGLNDNQTHKIDNPANIVSPKAIYLCCHKTKDINYESDSKNCRRNYSNEYFSLTSVFK